MVRIEQIPEAKMTDAQRDAFALFPSNILRGMLNTDPRIVSANARLAGSCAASDLDPELRELVIARVAALSESAYERFQHHDRALATGLTEKELNAIEVGDQKVLDPRKATVLRYVDDCFYRIKVPAATFAATRELISDGDLVAITLLVGRYVMTARFVETFEIDLDEAPGGWDAIDH